MFICLHLKYPQIVKLQPILSVFTKKYYRNRVPPDDGTPKNAKFKDR